jgi:hypothetical protein
VESAILCSDTGALASIHGADVDNLVHGALLAEEESYSGSLRSAVDPSQGVTGMGISIEAIEVPLPTWKRPVQLPAGLTNVFFTV